MLRLAIPRRPPRIPKRFFSERKPPSKPESKPPAKPERPDARKEEPKTEPVDIPTNLWYHRLGPVSSFFKWFVSQIVPDMNNADPVQHRKQQKRPLTVQLCTSLITYLCGDLLAQRVGGEKYDGWRTLRMLTIGSISSLPGYKWYGHLLSKSRLTQTGSSGWGITSTTAPRLSQSSPKYVSSRPSSHQSSTPISLACKQSSQMRVHPE